MAFITVPWVIYLQIFKTLEWKKLWEIRITFCILMKKKLACPPKLVSSSSSSGSSSSSSSSSSSNSSSIYILQVPATISWLQFLTLYKAYMNKVEFVAGNIVCRNTFVYVGLFSCFLWFCIYMFFLGCIYVFIKKKSVKFIYFNDLFWLFWVGWKTRTPRLCW